MDNTFGNSGMFTLEEFNKRGVIKLAPDALVYIGGSLQTSVLAPVDNKDYNLSFDDGISNINVQNNVDPPGSSTASIEVVAPIYGEKSKYWVAFRNPENRIVRLPVFVPMMEVKIYFKGRFLVGDVPRYYPAFWGMITSVEENYNGGVYKINLRCVDIMHWWAYSTINVHPTPADNIISGGNLKLTAYKTIFEKANPFDIIQRLTETMGMMDFVSPTWVAQLTPKDSIYPSALFNRVALGIMSYWRVRFQNLGNLLKMYGIYGNPINAGGIQFREPDSTQDQRKDNSESLAATRPTNFRSYVINEDLLKNFTPFFQYTEMGSFQASEYMSKLDIATEVKTRVDFELFQDVNGNFMFKPPFYNIDVRNIQPYVIKPQDIINYSVGTDSEGIVTVVQLHTAFAENMYTTPYARGEGFHMDIELTKKYGVRFKEFTIQYVKDKDIARAMALGHLSMINSKTITGSVSMPGRPEMRLGYPIYMEHRDSFHYVKSINHAFDYGGSFTTTLSLEAERQRLYSFGDNNNPQESHGWGSPLRSKVYRFVENLIPTPDKEDDTVPNSITDYTPDQVSELTALRNEGKIASMEQGRYEIDDIAKGADGLEELGEMAVTDKSAPLTDKYGYRVFGSFPYGRNLNPKCIDSDIGPADELPLVSNISAGSGIESRNMQGLFFKDKEGAVPKYLDKWDNDIRSKVASEDLAVNVSQPGVEITSRIIEKETPPPIVTSKNSPTLIKPLGEGADYYYDPSLPEYTPGTRSLVNRAIAEPDKTDTQIKLEEVKFKPNMTDQQKAEQLFGTTEESRQ